MPVYSISGYDILFMQIPKTGSTAIAHVLSSAGETRFYASIQKGRRLLRPRHATRDLINEFYTSSMFDASIAVVRNPIDRMLSQYRYQRRKSGLHKANLLSFNIWLRMSLAQFRRDPGYRDNHFRSQLDFITEKCKVFRFEDGLERPLAYLESITGVDLTSKLLIKNASPSINVSYSEKSLALIRDAYHDEFIEFGYYMSL